MERPPSSRLVGGGVAVVLALAQFRLIALVFGPTYRDSVDAALGVLEGRPHWRVYQSRVLSPYVIDGLAGVFPSFFAAHVCFSIVMLVASGALAWRIGARLAGRRGAVTGVVVFHLGFGLLLARPWLYAWDYVDAVVFLAFVDLVIAGRRWPWFVGLFAIGILNHEIAVFIALWMILDPIVRWVLGRRGEIERSPVDRALVAAGAACLVASVVVVEGLRRALLVEAIGPRIFVDAPAHAGQAFHWTLGDNLRQLGSIFTEWDYGMPFVVPALLVIVVAFAAQIAMRDPRRFAGLAVTYLGLVASLLAFGVLLETRIYVVLIPILVAGSVLVAAAPRSDAA